MTGRYQRTGSERLLRVHGHPTSQEEMRFNALRDQVRGETLVERSEAQAILVLLDLLEATQDTLEFLRESYRRTDEGSGLCYEGAAS